MRVISRRRVLGASGVGGAVLAGAPGSAAWAAAGPAPLDTALELATRADLAAATVPAEHAAVRLSGFAAAGDGGGGLYARLAEPVAEPDLWHVTSADGAYWELAEPVTSVRALGARGDGTTDDTEAFLAAARRGGTVYVPPTDTTYLCRRTIQLLDGDTWYGDGFRSRITMDQQPAEGNGELLGVGIAEQTEVVVRGVRVSGLHLDTGGLPNENGLGGSYCGDVYVDTMFFSNIGRKAITFQYHCDNVHCRDITVFHACQEPGSTHAAISVEGEIGGIDTMHDIGFENVTILETGYNGITVSDASRVTFDTVRFGDTAGAGSFVVFHREVTDSHVRGVQGGDTERRMISFGSQVTRCSVRDFSFGQVRDNAHSRSNAIECLGPDNRFERGGFDYANATGNGENTVAVLVMGRDVTLDAVTVRSCTATGHVVKGSAGTLPDNATTQGTPDDLAVLDCVLRAATTPSGIVSEGNGPGCRTPRSSLTRVRTSPTSPARAAGSRATWWARPPSRRGWWCAPRAARW